MSPAWPNKNVLQVCGCGSSGLLLSMNHWPAWKIPNLVTPLPFQSPATGIDWHAARPAAEVGLQVAEGAPNWDISVQSNSRTVPLAVVVHVEIPVTVGWTIDTDDYTGSIPVRSHRDITRLTELCKLVSRKIEGVIAVGVEYEGARRPTEYTDLREFRSRSICDRATVVLMVKTTGA